MKDLDMPTTFCQQRHITAFFYAAFTIPMAVQLLSLGQEAVHPTELKTTMNKESLSTFDDLDIMDTLTPTASTWELVAIMTRFLDGQVTWRMEVCTL